MNSKTAKANNVQDDSKKKYNYAKLLPQQERLLITQPKNEMSRNKESLEIRKKITNFVNVLSKVLKNQKMVVFTALNNIQSKPITMSPNISMISPKIENKSAFSNPKNNLDLSSSNNNISSIRKSFQKNFFGTKKNLFTPKDKSLDDRCSVNFDENKSFHGLNLGPCNESNNEKGVDYANDSKLASLNCSYDMDTSRYADERNNKLEKLLKRRKHKKDRVELYLLYDHSLYQIKRIIHGYKLRLLRNGFEHIHLFMLSQNNENRIHDKLSALLTIANSKLNTCLNKYFLRWMNIIRIDNKHDKIKQYCTEEVKKQSKNTLDIFKILNELMYNNFSAILKNKKIQIIKHKHKHHKLMDIGIKNVSKLFKKKYFNRMKLYSHKIFKLSLIIKYINTVILSQYRQSLSKIYQYGFNKQANRQQKTINLRNLINLMNEKYRNTRFHGFYALKKYFLFKKIIYTNSASRFFKLFIKYPAKIKKNFIRWAFCKMKHEYIKNKSKNKCSIKLIKRLERIFFMQKLLGFIKLKTYFSLSNIVTNQKREFCNEVFEVVDTAQHRHINENLINNFILRLKFYHKKVRYLLIKEAFEIVKNHKVLNHKKRNVLICLFIILSNKQKQNKYILQLYGFFELKNVMLQAVKSNKVQQKDIRTGKFVAIILNYLSINKLKLLNHGFQKLIVNQYNFQRQMWRKLLKLINIKFEHLYRAKYNAFMKWKSQKKKLSASNEINTFSNESEYSKWLKEILLILKNKTDLECEILKLLQDSPKVATKSASSSLNHFNFPNEHLLASEKMKAHYQNFKDKLRKIIRYNTNLIDEKNSIYSISQSMHKENNNNIYRDLDHGQNSFINKLLLSQKDENLSDMADVNKFMNTTELSSKNTSYDEGLIKNKESIILKNKDDVLKSYDDKLSKLRKKFKRSLNPVNDKDNEQQIDQVEQDIKNKHSAENKLDYDCGASDYPQSFLAERKIRNQLLNIKPDESYDEQAFPKKITEPQNINTIDICQPNRVKEAAKRPHDSKMNTLPELENGVKKLLESNMNRIDISNQNTPDMGDSAPEELYNQAAFAIETDHKYDSNYSTNKDKTISQTVKGENLNQLKQPSERSISQEFGYVEPEANFQSENEKSGVLDLIQDKPQDTTKSQLDNLYNNIRHHYKPVSSQKPIISENNKNNLAYNNNNKQTSYQNSLSNPEITKSANASNSRVPTQNLTELSNAPSRMQTKGDQMLYQNEKVPTTNPNNQKAEYEIGSQAYNCINQENRFKNLNSNDLSKFEQRLSCNSQISLPNHGIQTNSMPIKRFPTSLEASLLKLENNDQNGSENLLKANKELCSTKKDNIVIDDPYLSWQQYNSISPRFFTKFHNGNVPTLSTISSQFTSIIKNPFHSHIESTQETYNSTDGRSPSLYRSSIKNNEFMTNNSSQFIKYDPRNYNPNINDQSLVEKEFEKKFGYGNKYHINSVGYRIKSRLSPKSDNPLLEGNENLSIVGNPRSDYFKESKKKLNRLEELLMSKIKRINTHMVFFANNDFKNSYFDENGKIIHTYEDYPLERLPKESYQSQNNSKIIQAS